MAPARAVSGLRCAPLQTGVSDTELETPKRYEAAGSRRFVRLGRKQSTPQDERERMDG